MTTADWSLYLYSNKHNIVLQHMLDYWRINVKNVFEDFSSLEMSLTSNLTGSESFICNSPYLRLLTVTAKTKTYDYNMKSFFSQLIILIQRIKHSRPTCILTHMLKNHTHILINRINWRNAAKTNPNPNPNPIRPRGTLATIRPRNSRAHFTNLINPTRAAK